MSEAAERWAVLLAACAKFAIDPSLAECLHPFAYHLVRWRSGIGRRAGQRSPLATRTGVIPGIGHLAGGPQELRSTRTRPAHAKVGDLDPTFGTGGKVTTDISGMANADQANALVVQADGKLVAGGLASTGASDFALARYRAR